MGIVSGDPGRLRRYADVLMAPDAALRDDVPALRAALVLYRNANTDFGQDHTDLADELATVAEEAMAINTDLRLTAAAFEQLDAGTSTAGPLRVSRARFTEVRERIVGAWDRPDSLLDLVVAMDVDTWIEQVWGGWRCPPGLGDYGGSGGLLGPDGRVYPLVIPELEIDGTVAHVAYSPAPDRIPATLGGADAGWRVVAERTGIARVDPYEPTLFDQSVVIAAMATGMDGPSHRAASEEELATVGFAADGRPLLSGSIGRPPVDPRPEHLMQEPTPPVAPRAHRLRGDRAAGLLDMVVGAIDGTRVASELENPSTNLYHVLFEENEDGGRRRARLHTYQLIATTGGQGFLPFMGYVDGGRLRRKRVVPAPDTRQFLRPAPGAKGGASNVVGPASGRHRDDRDRSWKRERERVLDRRQ